MRWVQSEESGDQRASFPRSRKPEQQGKQQHYIRDVQGEVDEVMAGWIKPEQLHVQHV